MNEWLPRVYRCCGRCCHPDAFPSRIRGSGRRPHVGVSAGAQACNTPARFRRGDGRLAAARDPAPSLALPPVVQPGCCQGLTFHPDRG